MGKYTGTVQLLSKVTVELDADTLEEAENELEALVSMGCNMGMEPLTDTPPRTFAVICHEVVDPDAEED